MVIKNLTSKCQKLILKDFDEIYNVTLAPRGETKLYGVKIVNEKELEGIIEIDGNTIKNSIKEPTPVAPIIGDENDAVVGEDDGNSNESQVLVTESDDESKDSDNESGEGTEEDEDDENHSLGDDTNKVAEDKFICDICGAEFASQRGLDTHKSRSHNDN